MEKYIYLALLLITVSANAATKQDIEDALKPHLESCRLGGVHFESDNETPFISLYSIECTHFTVSLTTNIHFDVGFDYNMANPIRSHTHDNKTLSSIMTYPPSNSIYIDYKYKANGKTINYLDRYEFKKLMGYIYKKRIPYSKHTLEDLKMLKGKKSLVMTQQIEVNFIKLDEAYDFLEYATKNHYKRPISNMTISK